MKSNPVGYGNWFKEQMIVQFNEQKKSIANLKRVNVESIEDFEVKTPLQRAVQILKRHRDFMFGDDEDRPISIIITTLAAKAYKNEPTIYEALLNLLENMPNYIEGEQGVRKVYNPVNPKENFADKWENHPERENNFYDWLSKAKADFIEVFNTSGFQKSITNLRDAFGENIVNGALRKRGLENLIETKELTRKSFSNIFAVSYKEVPKWEMRLSKDVVVSAYYGSIGRRRTVNSKDVIPKGTSIRFTANTKVEPPFDVFWQVVNTGQEAFEKNDLRGEIFSGKSAGKGGLQHSEITSYGGTHWVECFIIKYGVCVARSQEFIVRIQ